MNSFELKRKKDEVLNHWISFADGFSMAPSEFYDAVEKEMATRKLPRMEVSRIEFAEGGLLSEKRIYLRMIRERLAFDICAAPFGTVYFFSCWSIYTPPVVKIWQVIVVLGVFGLVYSLLAKVLGMALAIVAVIALVVAIASMFRNAVAMGLADLDALLLKSPIVGPIYERWFRKETYYRQDTRLAFLETVPSLVQGLADEFTAAKGIKLVRQYEQAPILGGLYKRLPGSESLRGPEMPK